MNIPENNCSDNCNAKLICLFDEAIIALVLLNVIVGI